MARDTETQQESHGNSGKRIYFENNTMTIKDAEDRFIEILEKWSEEGLDERIETAADNFSEWIKDTTDTELEALVDLLIKFDYYSREIVLKELMN